MVLLDWIPEMIFLSFIGCEIFFSFFVVIKFLLVFLIVDKTFVGCVTVVANNNININRSLPYTKYSYNCIIATHQINNTLPT